MELQLERYSLNKGLQLFTNIVTSREFLSFKTTLSSEILLDLRVIFPKQLESPHLDVCRRSYGKNMKTAQS